MRICIIYDCLFPHTVGGAERWYRNLSERLVGAGHQVTYLTLRQWDSGADPGLAGVDVRTVGPRMRLYTTSGRRRILPPLVFGIGVLWHLLRHGRSYDVVHTASFPYFSVLAATIVRPLAAFRIVIDWFEVWTLAYWRGYLGRVGGAVGWLVQRLCARTPHRALCFSRLHAARLRSAGFAGEIVLLGAYHGSLVPDSVSEAEPVIVFAGRHIPEKRVPAIVPALAQARQSLPHLRAEILGDGPERDSVRRAVAELGLGDAVAVPGFVPSEVLSECLRTALCVLLPSRREGYGLIVLEAAARGTPSVVVADPDNAAVELICEGENGFVAPSASAADLAEAILRIHAGGMALRDSTSVWFARNASLLSLERSLDTVLEAYGAAQRTPVLVA